MNSLVKINNPLSITIRIGGEWTERNSEPYACSCKERIAFIKKEVLSIEEEVIKRNKKQKGSNKLRIRSGSMRAMHGAELLPRFRKLCKITDILIFDITGENPNVMLELGMALCEKAEYPGRVFIFKQEVLNGKPVPSDLNGYFITKFNLLHLSKKQCNLKLVDLQGFKAALRSVIIDIARERDMWADKTSEEED